jgi:murein DD-endopeptidase MepM/ murein hydrolase activator NlpD
MNIRIGVFGALLMLAALGVYGEEKIHTVQKDETFYSIARTLGIKADDLMKYNGITDPTRLQAGQRLKIPGTAQIAASGFTTYRVVWGDTFYSIARKFSVTVASILEINGLAESYMLREGDSLRLPTEAMFPVTAKPAELPQGGNSGSKTTVSSVSWPVAAKELSYMTGKLSGVVITGERAEPVRSLIRGTVLSVGPFQGFGRVVIVQVDGGYWYVYGGCESLLVKEGDKVGPGTELGKLGIDAVSNKPQLFFLVYKGNAFMDPVKAPRA